MAKSTQVSVGSLSGASTQAIIVGGPRVKVSVPASAAAGVYVGGDENTATDPTKKSGTADALSASTGFLIAVGTTQSFELSGSEVLYGVSASGTTTQTVHVFRTNARYA